MSDIRKYVKLLEDAEKHLLYEGVKLGKKEIEETLKNSQDFQMGIEYEFLMPNGGGVADAINWANQNNIPYIEAVKPEHDSMVEIITERMPITTGIKHIQDFFALAKKSNITFPSYAGMHVSISHKNASNLPFNYTKFLVLLSAGYLHTIFPEREHVQSSEEELIEFINSDTFKSLKDVEKAVNNIMLNSDRGIAGKYVTSKLSDYSTSDGRIELRFFGGKDYDRMYDNIRWHVLRAVYVLKISLDDKMFFREYVTQLSKLVNKAESRIISSSKQSYELLLNNDAEYTHHEEEIVSKSPKYSYLYAKNVLKDRFKEGEETISNDTRYALLYVKNILKDRFEDAEDLLGESPVTAGSYILTLLKLSVDVDEILEILDNGEINLEDILEYDSSFIDKIARLNNGEYDEILDLAREAKEFNTAKQAMDKIKENTLSKTEIGKLEEIISTNPMVSFMYAQSVIKGKFEKGEDAIAMKPYPSLEYARKVLKGRFEKGEPAIATDTALSILYSATVIHGRFKLGEKRIASAGNPTRSLMYIVNLINNELPEKDILDAMETVNADNIEKISQNMSRQLGNMNIRGKYPKVYEAISHLL